MTNEHRKIRGEGIAVQLTSILRWGDARNDKQRSQNRDGQFHERRSVAPSV
jgi:hypothetical protein